MVVDGEIESFNDGAKDEIVIGASINQGVIAFSDRSGTMVHHYPLIRFEDLIRFANIKLID